MKSKCITITGHKGFIGSHLVEKLAPQHLVRGWDIAEGKDIFSNFFEKLVKYSDIVIHLAAQVSVEKSFKDPTQSFYTNVLGTARVLELCIKYKKKLIFPSSAAVYHPELSPYAASKKMAEDLVWEARHKIPVVILRFFNIYGENMNKDSGSVMYRFLTDDPITIYGDGEQTRDYINIKDIVNIITASLKPKWNNKIVDCGTGQAYSANYIAGLFSFYRNVPIIYEPPKREIKWSIADTSTLFSLFRRNPLQTNIRKDIKALCLK